MARYDVQFSFSIRQALNVAISVARAVDGDLRFGRELLEGQDTRTDDITVLRVVSDGPAKSGTCSVRVRFEGGTDVTVLLFNTVTLVEGWRRDWRKEDWVVYGASARYYHLDSSFRRVGDSKAEKQFSAEELLRLRQSPVGWYNPHVQDVTTITSDVGIFWDNGAGTGHIEVDPEYNDSGHSTLRDRVSYAVLISGDRERALAEARKLLASYGNRE